MGSSIRSGVFFRFLAKASNPHFQANCSYMWTLDAALCTGSVSTRPWPIHSYSTATRRGEYGWQQTNAAFYTKDQLQWWCSAKPSEWGSNHIQVGNACRYFINVSRESWNIGGKKWMPRGVQLRYFNFVTCPARHSEFTWSSWYVRKEVNPICLKQSIVILFFLSGKALSSPN